MNHKNAYNHDRDWNRGLRKVLLHLILIVERGMSPNKVSKSNIYKCVEEEQGCGDLDLLGSRGIYT